MTITGYTFGKITIDRQTYTKDVLIYPDRVFSPWWRKEGHLLQTDDLTGIMKEQISLLIIGTGYYGAMMVPKDVLDYLTSQNVEAYVATTAKAVDRYNNTATAHRVAAAFHLTC